MSEIKKQFPEIWLAYEMGVGCECDGIMVIELLKFIMQIEKNTDAVQSEIARLTQRVRDLEDVNRWVSVKERLPDDSGAYYVVKQSKTTKQYYSNDTDFDAVTEKFEIFDDEVFYWLEVGEPVLPTLPTLPEVEG